MLDIGSTISHFAIASLLCVFLAGLEGVSALFIMGVERMGQGMSHRPRVDKAEANNGEAVGASVTAAAVTNGTAMAAEQNGL